MGIKLVEASSVDTTNDYVTLVSIRLEKVNVPYSAILIHLKEENTDAIKFKIQVSQHSDFTDPEDLKSETVLAKNGSTYEWFSEPWLNLRVQHKASSEGSQGKTSCIISG